MPTDTDVLRPGLPALRLWIDRLAADYEKILHEDGINLSWRKRRAYRKAIRSLKRTCHSGPEGSAKKRIRELIAAGIVRYGIAQTPLPQGRVPKQVIVDFAAFALWPLVIAPDLTKQYLRSLTEITSQPLADLVWEKRLSQETHAAINMADFARQLAAIELAPGVLNLLGDLSDPLRGGTSLIAINLAATGTVPPSRRSPKAMVTWILSAAATGIVGNRADAEIVSLWHWLIANSDLNPAGYSPDPGGHVYIWSHDRQRSDSASEHQVSAASQIVHDLMHWYS